MPQRRLYAKGEIIVKKRYCVIQGNFTKSGTGDYWDVGEFDTLGEARRCMYEIYDNMDGISKEPNGYLETLIELKIISPIISLLFSKYSGFHVITFIITLLEFSSKYFTVNNFPMNSS